MANGHVAVGSAEAYLFGNYASRAVDGSFFYRNPIRRTGVFSNDGGQTLLVGDLTPADGVACPAVPIVGGKPEVAALAAVASNPACFAFNERHPGGFTPRFGGTVEDYSAVAGIRGELANGWRYDLSGSVGQNGIKLGISNTVNASMGPASPTDFQLGQQVQREELLNLDLQHDLEIGWQGPLSVAFGLQQHNESFRIVAGEPAS